MESIINDDNLNPFGKNIIIPKPKHKPQQSVCGLNMIDDDSWKIIEDKVINNINLDFNKANVVNYDVDNDVDKDNVLLSKYDSNIRKSKICFLEYDEEINKLLGKMVADYNRLYSSWKYDIKKIEDAQVTHYYEGDFYGWHVDQFEINGLRHEEGEEFNRKISVTIWLNEPEEYEGGEFDLEVRGPNCDDIRYDTFKLPKKSIILFPSNVWHRVRPVTSGVRKSLVLWFSGPPFR